jgi:diphthamide synthase subunit DPH2
LGKAVVGTKNGQYTQESKDKLYSAIKTAESALESDDDSQENFDKAAETLNTAVENFKNNVIKESIDKQGLQTSVDDADNLLKNAVIGTKKGQYKQDKADKLKDSIKNANKVLGSHDSSQDAIKKANEDLDKAVANFKA